MIGKQSCFKKALVASLVYRLKVSMKSKSESEVAQSYPTLCPPWTVAYQAPPSMGFSRQECWSGLPFPSPGNLPDPGSSALQADCLPLSCQGRVRKVGKLSKIYQFSSFTQLCPTLCDSKDCSTSGLPVHHQLPEFTQTHVC